MKWAISCVTLLLALTYCTHAPPEWYAHQDTSIKMPPFDATTKVDEVVDGPTLQALRIAADDFAPNSSESAPCSSRQAAQIYRVSRSGDIIFVEVSGDPAACGGQGHFLDGTARYAINKEGRILRRVMDGEGENAFPDDAGELRAVYPLPDEGTPFDDSRVGIDFRYTPPWMFDAGMDAGVDMTPDGGADAGVTGADGGAAELPQP